MFSSYYQTIQIFLENKFEEHDIDVPDYIEMDKLAYVFGNYCYADFGKSVEKQFYDFFDLQNINWEKVNDKIENLFDIEQ